MDWGPCCIACVPCKLRTDGQTVQDAGRERLQVFGLRDMPSPCSALGASGDVLPIREHGTLCRARVQRAARGPPDIGHATRGGPMVALCGRAQVRCVCAARSRGCCDPLNCAILVNNIHHVSLGVPNVLLLKTQGGPACRWAPNCHQPRLGGKRGSGDVLYSCVQAAPAARDAHDD